MEWESFKPFRVKGVYLFWSSLTCISVSFVGLFFLIPRILLQDV